MPRRAQCKRAPLRTASCLCRNRIWSFRPPDMRAHFAAAPLSRASSRPACSSMLCPDGGRMPRGCRHTIWLATLLLAACGGGSGGGSDSDSSSTVGGSGGSLYAAGGANVVAITVGPGPSGVSTFNIPYTSVPVCINGTSSCVTIDHVLVDTGSTGLRVMASVLAGLTLTQQVDPNNSTHVIAECLPFADGYAWGVVATAAISIGG